MVREGDWKVRARYMAEQRTVRFMTLLNHWTDWQNEYPQLQNKTLVGGRTRVQSAHSGRNPVVDHPARPNYSTTQGSHFVQADIDELDVKEFPEEVLRVLHETYFVPSCWNQAIDKSIDKIQEKFIQRFNNQGQVVDQQFVRDFLEEVIQESGIYLNIH